jgi:2-iminobutanoate/2-iminopropanoate deaminase
MKPRPDPWRGILPAVAVLALASCSAERAAELRPAHHREVVQPEGLARLPVFSTAIRNGDMLWMSGQIGTLPGVTPPTLVEGGVEAQTRQAFENIEAVLTAAGLGLGDLVKCTVFLADIGDYAAMNAVYATYFQGMDPPARSALAGSGLALGARVEIECIAAYPSER